MLGSVYAVLVRKRTGWQGTVCHLGKDYNTWCSCCVGVLHLDIGCRVMVQGTRISLEQCLVNFKVHSDAAALMCMWPCTPILQFVTLPC